MSMFIERMLWQLRELKRTNPDFDFAAIAQSVASDKNLPNKSGAERKQVMEVLAKNLLIPLSEISAEPRTKESTSQALLLNQVQELQTRLRTVQSEKPDVKPATIAVTPNRGILPFLVRSPAGSAAPSTPAPPGSLGPETPQAPAETETEKTRGLTQ